MNQPSYLVLTLDIVNLLLTASGLLFAYFDWSAARRREFLYLYFVEEKPGVNYFAAARRRRAQYTRLITAFAVLLLRQVLAVILFARIANPHDWQQWVAWWGSQETATVAPAAASLQLWVYCLEMLGLALLASGFLYNGRQERNSVIDISTAAPVTVWLFFMLLVMVGAFGPQTVHIVRLAAEITRVVLVAVVLGTIWMRRNTPDEKGLLPFEPRILGTAFVAWLLGSLYGDITVSLAGGPIGHIIAYTLLASLVTRGAVGEYESVESSRHRFGRERQVIFSFLQRVGAAFTTSVDVDQVLRIVLETALESSEASAGAIYLYNKADSKLLEPSIVLNFFPPLHIDTPAAHSAHRTEELEEEMKHQSFRLGEGVIGTVAQSGKGRIIDDVRAEGVMLGSTTDFMRNRSMLLVPLRIRDEPLGVMAVLNKQRGSFGRDDLGLLQALADQGALFINNAILTMEIDRQARLRSELQIAREIQQRMLPDKCPTVQGFEIAARGTAANEMGGDYYDFFWVDDDRLGIVIADVSGKGVHAALIVAMIRSAFRTLARGNTNVREVLAGVNEFMSQDLRSDMFITAVYGILEVSSRTFTWGRAGHEPLLVAHAAAPTELLAPCGFALGVLDPPEFHQTLEVQSMQLNPGDRILLFTDGLTEAMNSEGEEFGMQRILQVMNHDQVDIAASPNGQAVPPVEPLNTVGVEGKLEHPCNGPIEPDDMMEIERAVSDHVGDAPQSDDLTIVYLAAK